MGSAPWHLPDTDTFLTLKYSRTLPEHLAIAFRDGLIHTMSTMIHERWGTWVVVARTACDSMVGCVGWSRSLSQSC